MKKKKNCTPKNVEQSIIRTKKNKCHKKKTYVKLKIHYCNYEKMPNTLTNTEQIYMGHPKMLIADKTKHIL